MAVPPLRLSSRTVTTLALILNELVSNAGKHAFQEGRGGTLSISLDREGEELALRVRDDGPGLPDGFDLDAHAHVGLDVVRVLAERDLDGRFSVAGEDGVVAEVRFAA
jgi:two-component sensor histidine kinase